MLILKIVGLFYQKYVDGSVNSHGIKYDEETPANTIQSNEFKRTNHHKLNVDKIKSFVFWVYI